MKERVVAGLYIERDGVTAVVAFHPHLDILPLIGPSLRVETLDYYPFTNKEKASAEEVLLEATRDIAAAFPEVYSVAVACFGPFVSLMRRSTDYGLLHAEYGSDPFKGTNVYRLVRNELISSGLHTRIKVTTHTDANAFTLGEAVVRKNERNHILVGILATEGVGGGIVRGNSTYQSALHPELGLAMPRFDKDDPMKPPRGDRLFSRSIGELASNYAMRKRYASEFELAPKDVKNSDLEGWRDPKHWNFRSYYLAQLCFFCACFLTPHEIVIASDLDPKGTLVKDVRHFFNELKNARDIDGQPLLDYDEFRQTERFISPITPYSDPVMRDFEPDIGITGAYGACLLAARVSRGGPT
jgi:hypothetical protein